MSYIMPSADCLLLLLSASCSPLCNIGVAQRMNNEAEHVGVKSTFRALVNDPSKFGLWCSIRRHLTTRRISGTLSRDLRRVFSMYMEVCEHIFSAHFAHAHAINH